MKYLLSIVLLGVSGQAYSSTDKCEFSGKDFNNYHKSEIISLNIGQELSTLDIKLSDHVNGKSDYLKIKYKNMRDAVLASKKEINFEDECSKEL